MTGFCEARCSLRSGSESANHRSLSLNLGDAERFRLRASVTPCETEPCRRETESYRTTGAQRTRTQGHQEPPAAFSMSGGGVLETCADAAGSAPAAFSAAVALPAQFSVRNILLVFMRDIIANKPRTSKGNHSQNISEAIRSRSDCIFFACTVYASSASPCLATSGVMYKGCS